MADEQLFNLPEYEANQFIAAMRPPLSVADLVNEIHNPVPFRAEERQLMPHLRRHCVLRLLDWFFPTEEHTILAERLDMLIRRGYLARNPNDGTWTRRLAHSADLREAGVTFDELQPRIPSSAHAFSLLGTPGMGKTTSKSAVLKRYDQVIRHDGSMKVKQIVYLEVECPSGGSLRQLLKNILTEIDRALGQRKYHRAGRYEVDDLLFEVAQALQLHAVGVLVIDEINFLNAAKTDKERVVNFLTTLVNVFCVPVLFVGTGEGASVLTGTLRNGRRASGLGSLSFEAWDCDDQWMEFVERLFRYQWLTQPTAFNEELAKVLWEESRGILDVVVKLFILAQFRVIRAFEVDEVEEVLTPQLFRDISRTDLRLVQPMLDALRKGTAAALTEYPDLKPLKKIFEKALIDAGLEKGQRKVSDLLVPPPLPASPREALIEALRGYGLPEAQASSFMAALECDVDLRDPIAMLEAIPEALEKTESQAPPKRKRKPKPEELPEDDLRRIRAGSASAYEGFKAAGMMGGGA